MKSLNNFAWSAMIAKRDGDQNPSTSVVAETTKSQADLSNGH